MKSVKDYFYKEDKQKNERGKLENDAKQFKIPSEWLPQCFKYLFFFGLAMLNMRLFTATVPGWQGYAVGLVAIVSEMLALYALHNFSRAIGLFRIVLGATFIALMIFAITHSYFSFMDMIGLADLSEEIHEYARFYAFPILATLIGVSTSAICLTHPSNIVRMSQAKAHTDIVVSKAETASKLVLFETHALVDNAELEHIREKNQHEQEYLIELTKHVDGMKRRLALLASIPDNSLREALAREMGIDPESLNRPALPNPEIRKDAYGNGGGNGRYIEHGYPK